jgi:hypothetical protein
MGGLFDKLQNKIENRTQEGGISAIDIASLPPTLRKIMRLMLRENEMAYTAIREAVEAMAEADRISPADLSEALNTLTAESWLIRLGQEDAVTYRVNLRRKAGSGLGGAIWARLESRMDQNKAAPQEQEPDTPLPSEPQS